MRFVVFGLTASSTWGNGHATLWRGLARALGEEGHALLFLERDQPRHAAHRDLAELPGAELRIYAELDDVRAEAIAALDAADVAMVTSSCPDALEASDLARASRARLKAFYDLDPGVTAAGAAAGDGVAWIGEAGLVGFDLALSLTGGGALDLLCALGATAAAPLHGSVDPEVHRPSVASAPFRADASCLGTWAPARQPGLERLLLGPAAAMADRTFVLGGSRYPDDFPWRPNLRWVRDLEPALHPAFLCSSPLTVIVTRPELAALGHCPSPRLFEAAACGVPVLSDGFEGLDAFFAPGEEVLVARSVEEAVEAIASPREELAAMGRRARERALAEHTAAARARELVRLCEAAARGDAPERPVRGPDDARDQEHRWTIEGREGSTAR
jgi:spore maturation protein CgeB